MRYDPERHRRRTMRWEGYDYALAGAYVVTIVTRERRHLVGAIRDDAMIPNAAGRVVQDTWLALPERFPTITLDAFVVMPNHIHGIIILNEATEMDHGFSALGRASPALATNRGASIPETNAWKHCGCVQIVVRYRREWCTWDHRSIVLATRLLRPGDPGSGRTRTIPLVH